MTKRPLMIPVLEIFGPTFQGEGRAIGQKTMFVRTAGCDYHCAWCDSAFTWDGSEKPKRMTADEIIAELDKLGAYDYVILSGGNPCLLGANMGELVVKLKARDVTLGIETQGSRWQTWLKDIDQVTFKIPVFNDEDLTFAKMIQKHYQSDVLYLSAGNPGPHASGNIVEAQLNRLRQLWETVTADSEWKSVRVLPQLHTLLYDNKRGV
ncbi:radical SAM protein [Streptococcus infantarius]|uniref:radical SAM protein n=1 Tax=Streptococcus infantarius TaxID=102684 RepID=UPI0022E7D8FE|nr:radical SAM protein [Streptococcus infantarius]